MNRKGYSLGELLIVISITIIIVSFIVTIFFASRSCSRAIDLLDNKGLKAVVERVWEGEDMPKEEE